jgi:hypothetical protein
VLSIVLNGQTVGQASLNGGVISAACPADKKYIYRLELTGSTRLPLGVMMPRGNEFVLTRSNIPQGDWSGCEVLRSLPGEKICPPLPFALSHGEAVGDGDFCSDELLKSCLCCLTDAKTALVGGERYIYFPWRTDASCPMAPFFFCMRVFDAGNVQYAAIKITDGIPKPV